MKCPKCGYLGFEQVERCRNCGYEFTLKTPGAATPELLIQERASESSASFTDLGLAKEPSTASTPSPSQDLPLFAQAPLNDEPLIKSASAPRQPLAVRRATPEMPRLRSERTQSFDLAFDEPGITSSARPAVEARHRSRAITMPERRAPVDAGLGRRFVAAAIDLLILTGVDVAVIYFTAQICGITMSEAGMLPKGPLLTFLVVQNGGYLAAFTAGGQTLGKMATGIRVVAAEPTESLDLGRAVLRTAVWLALAIPAGLGFLTAFLTPDHRGLHDRFAGTRVVRASA